MKKRFLLLISLFILLFSLSSCNNILNKINDDNNEGGRTYIQTSGSGFKTKTSKEIIGTYNSIKDTFVLPDTTNEAYYSGTDKNYEAQRVDVVSSNKTEVVNLVVSNNTSSGQGSGVFVAYDNTYNLSYILTCYHMVEDMNEIIVYDYLENEYEGIYVGGYSDYDLALIAIKTPNYDINYASILDYDINVSEGQTAIAIGNNNGYNYTVSSGIISYVNRPWTTSVYDYKTIDLLQIDTEINGGNSGGALYSTSGALIGITAAGVETNSSGSSIEGIKFAIPYESILTVIEDIKNTAEYNPDMNDFLSGYHKGDFEFKSTFSIGTYGGYWNQSNVIYVQALSDDETSSDYNKFQRNDIIVSFKLDYQDDNKEDITYNALSAYQEKGSILYYLYNSDLSLGDKIIFTITRTENNQNISKEVEITLTQYRYDD